MRDLLEHLADAATARCEYADIRHVRDLSERIVVCNGEVEEAESSESRGVGVRVRVRGVWGFAATRSSAKADCEAALRRAIEIAAAQPLGDEAPLAAEPPHRGEYRSPLDIDPESVPRDAKLDVLLAANMALRRQPEIRVARTQFTSFRTDKIFASTEGALCEQRLVECGGGMSATAVSPEDVQTLSYPGAHEGLVRQGGYERFLDLDLVAAAPKLAANVAALLRAPSCPTGPTALILAGEQLAVQLHESIGHALELDRILGLELSHAGDSFVPAHGRGSFRLGSEFMNVTADPMTPGGLGSFRWDDEGVAARRAPLVSGGLVAGFLTGRECAGAVGLERSSGCMRAGGFDRQPLVRMSNVHLEPGDAETLDDLIATTERGVLMGTNRAWSIDQRRLRFQFEAEAAWEIVGGARGRLLKNAGYAGVTPRFWASLDAVCSADEWRLHSLLHCGKGDPLQTVRVSHGCAPARFRDINVGAA